MMWSIVNVPNGPIPAGSTPLYTGRLVDIYGNGIPASVLDTLTLTIADTLSENIIGNVDHIDILNTNRGTLDANGNLAIQLHTTDTLIFDIGVRKVQRSLVIDWTYSNNALDGKHQANFIIVQLAGIPPGFSYANSQLIEGVKIGQYTVFQDTSGNLVVKTPDGLLIPLVTGP